MATRLSRGEIWLYTFEPPDKRRPVLVLTRQTALPYLSTAVVAPITSSIRGTPGEVVVGPEHGLKSISAVNLDLVQTVPQSRLQHFVGTLPPEKMSDVCRALAIATGCTA